VNTLAAIAGAVSESTRSTGCHVRRRRPRLGARMPLRSPPARWPAPRSREPGVTRRWRCGRRRSRPCSFGARAFLPRREPASPSLGDAAQLLDVDVDELARAVHLVAADRASSSCRVVEPVQPVAHQHRVHRRRLQAAEPAMRAGPKPRFWRSVTTRRSIEALVSGWGTASAETSDPRVRLGPPPDSGATRRRPGPSRSPWPLRHGPPASRLRSAGTRAATLWGQASVRCIRSLLGERVAEQLHTRLGGFIYGWTLFSKGPWALHGGFKGHGNSPASR